MARKSAAVLEPGETVEKEAPKRRVQVRAVTITNPDTHKPEIQFRAVTLDGKKEVHGDGATEADAIRALKSELTFREELHETRRQYPKTVEVDW